MADMGKLIIGRFANHRESAYIRGMPGSERLPDDMQVLIDYAKQRYAEERWPLSPSLRPVREALDRLSPPTPPIPPPKPPHGQSLHLRQIKARP